MKFFSYTAALSELYLYSILVNYLIKSLKFFVAILVSFERFFFLINSLLINRYIIFESKKMNSHNFQQFS